MNREHRDARRWTAFERLAADPAASASERAQAMEQIEALRQRYPEARPVDPAERQQPRGGRGDRRGRWAEEPEPAQPEEDPAEAKRRREEAVQRQVAAVERVPGWQASAILGDLRSCRSAWSAEEQAAFKAERIRLTGSSRAVDL